MDIRIAQEDHPYLLEWLSTASRDGGGFVSNLARAGLVADAQNYRYLRPVLVAMSAKYPLYGPSEAVKRELETAVREFEARCS